mgnify:CR=1 FL=1
MKCIKSYLPVWVMLFALLTAHGVLAQDEVDEKDKSGYEFTIVKELLEFFNHFLS